MERRDRKSRRDVIIAIVDIRGRQVLVHRQPAADGYTEITAYSAEEKIFTLSQPDISACVADLLPPVAREKYKHSG